MHHSGTTVLLLVSSIKKKHYGVTSPKFKLLIHDTGPTYNMQISYIAM